MGLFSATSPLEADIDKATSEKNTNEEWGLIMDVCDKVGKSSVNSKDSLRLVVKRLNNADPHVALQAVTLLDALVNNCGKNFHLEIASRDFEAEYRKLLTKSHPLVQQKLKELLKKWAEGDFKADPQLNLIPSLYYKLKSEGIDFTVQSDVSAKKPAVLSKDPNVVTTQQEEDDIARAIELSLKEKSASPRSAAAASAATASSAAAASSSLYPTTANLSSVTTAASSSPAATTAMAPSATERKVRALYDFEAAEDNELTFMAGEIIHVTDDADPNWWKGYNQRGEGLFPANFVTADLSVEPEQFRVAEKKKVAKEAAAAAAAAAASSKHPYHQPQHLHQHHVVEDDFVEIDPGKIDRLLHLLHEADPSDAQHDTAEMLSLEAQVNRMGPLIDAELERVDRKHARLTQLSADLVEALNLYHTLMREPQFAQPMPMPIPMVVKGQQFAAGYAPQQPPQQQQQMAPNMYNGGMPPFAAYQPMPPQQLPQQQLMQGLPMQPAGAAPYHHQQQQHPMGSLPVRREEAEAAARLMQHRFPPHSQVTNSSFVPIGHPIQTFPAPPPGPPAAPGQTFAPNHMM